MKTILKNPEMRQLQVKKNSGDNCRPSGLFRFPRGNKKPTGKRLFAIQTNPDITKTGASKRWIVLSSGKRSVLVRYLFLKYIYDELTREEYYLFLSFSETTSIVPIFFALRARINRIPKKVIRKILEKVQFPKFTKVSREEYLSLRQIEFQIEEKIYPPIKKPKPYSGYSKGYKDGRRRSKFTVEEFDSSPLEPSPLFEDEIKTLINFALEVSQHPRKFQNMLTQSKGEEDGV